MGWNDIFDKGKEWQQGLSMAASFAPQGQEYAQSNAGLRAAANFGGRLIDEGNNPKNKGPENTPAPEPAEYRRDYAAELDATRKFNPMAGASLMPQQQPQGGPGAQDTESGQKQGFSLMDKANNDIMGQAAAGQAASAANAQQGSQNMSTATTLLSAAGYSI